MTAATEVPEFLQEKQQEGEVTEALVEADMEEEREVTEVPDKEREEVPMEGVNTEAPGGEREEVDIEGGRDDDFDNATWKLLKSIRHFRLTMTVTAITVAIIRMRRRMTKCSSSLAMIGIGRELKLRYM